MKNISRFTIPLIFSVIVCWAQEVPLPHLPAVRAKGHLASLTLTAVNENGLDAFSFHGAAVAPVLRVSPGDTLNITYLNKLPTKSDESCAIGMCMNMTNLHFHGLEVSPNGPQDDVIGMMAEPGQRLQYALKIPRGHPPGLDWYHTHPHGESHRQALDGMSGAIVIEGMERYVPEVANLREQILVVRGQSIEHAANARELKSKVQVSSKACGGETEQVEEIFTVNGVLRPQIEIAPGEKQFWRLVNASPDRYLDIDVAGQVFKIVALDGMPLAYHDPNHPTRTVGHLLLPPGGRLEAVVTGPATGSGVTMRTRCVDTGPDGDPNPGMVLADLVEPRTIEPQRTKHPHDADEPPAYKTADLSHLQASAPDFVVTFTEDKQGFYINGKKYSPEADPMTTARVGSYQHWRIVNQTAELHPFHIHQVHFLAYAENGLPLRNAAWLDTVNVPYKGSVDVILDFTNPIIRGMSVFHCHLLNHEDKGMMAKILIR